ncbi:hypothetical protein KY290_003570 [Solanum tuberosum]|uniref:Uncharacterized protein n=1 Tax=Solanum tuberosum TaxID=4113 RepID=A0ABQ7WTA2_SOLTU|nr:hypothetical protein KY289_003911 [Solanum tuberosum]KAH0783972.1 hypothetical protein KY290_003570 [Solanum tuberosum]
MKRDREGKYQNYGVTLSARTDSFANARDQTPLMERLSIIELFKISLRLIIGKKRRDTYFREKDDDIGKSNRMPNVDLTWSREDVPGDVIDMPTYDQHLEYKEKDIKTSEED